MVELLAELVGRVNLEVVEIEPRAADANPYLEQQKPRPLYDAHFDERVDHPVSRSPKEGYVGIPMHVSVSIANDPVIGKHELRLVEIERGQPPLNPGTDLHGEQLDVKISEEAATEHVTRLGTAQAILPVADREARELQEGVAEVTLELQLSTDEVVVSPKQCDVPLGQTIGTKQVTLSVCDTSLQVCARLPLVVWAARQ